MTLMANIIIIITNNIELVYNKYQVIRKVENKRK